VVEISRVHIRPQDFALRDNSFIYSRATIPEMSHSNKHRSSKHKDSKMEAAANEAVLQRIKDSLQQIDDMLVDEPHNWQAWLPTARSSMTALDGMHFFRNTARFQEQAWIIQRLQDYAFHDADSGSIRDVADWCQRSWLRVLRDHPEDVTILTGTFIVLRNNIPAPRNKRQKANISHSRPWSELASEIPSNPSENPP
jgi:hypothetical protein